MGTVNGILHTCIVLWDSIKLTWSHLGGGLVKNWPISLAHSLSKHEKDFGVHRCSEKIFVILSVVLQMGILVSHLILHFSSPQLLFINAVVVTVICFIIWFTTILFCIDDFLNFFYYSLAPNEFGFWTLAKSTLLVILVIIRMLWVLVRIGPLFPDQTFRCISNDFRISYIPFNTILFFSSDTIKDIC